MSFRNRLTLFFVLIVVVPMLAVGVVLFELLGTNAQAKDDADITTALRVATNLRDESVKRAQRAALTIGQGDVRLAEAIRRNDRAALRVRAQELLGREGVSRIVIYRDEAQVLVDVGERDAVFPVKQNLVDRPQTPPVGVLQVSAARAESYVRRVQAITELDAVLLRDGVVLATTGPSLPRDALRTPERKVYDLDTPDEEYRAAAFGADGFLGQRVVAAVLDERRNLTSEIAENRLLAGGILLGFFILALTFAAAVSRSLQTQVQSFLQAARRLGSGDFTATVPTSGRDEFAALGEEFNKMSRQLESRLQELAQERERLQEAMRRIGQTFASNLNRNRLLEIVVKTAVDGVGADAGRASVRRAAGEPLEQVAAAGSANGVGSAIRAAEHEVVESGHQVELTLDGVTALAYPLREEQGGGIVVSGVVSVARDGRRFATAERELFHYLAGQAAVSLDNVGLHETVERQAVTDELTGLANRRRFEETLESEVERFRRFGQPLALVLLDIDNFKIVNDTHGHQQGDVVLREVARVLRESSREVDEPARYGGEELAVVLPGTDLEGAVNLAERVRRGIEALEVRVGTNGPLRVTASLGVATLPGSGYDARSLVEAADDALYRAKRLGKNRTERSA
jgi:diguanylate cyclase (GGDEF)-like protein